MKRLKQHFLWGQYISCKHNKQTQSSINNRMESNLLNERRTNINLLVLFIGLHWLLRNACGPLVALSLFSLMCHAGLIQYIPYCACQSYLYEKCLLQLNITLIRALKINQKEKLLARRPVVSCYTVLKVSLTTLNCSTDMTMTAEMGDNTLRLHQYNNFNQYF